MSNVIGVHGGKVHYAHPVNVTAFPNCRTGAQTNSGTRYQTTEAPVTCKNCLVSAAPVAVEVPTTREIQPCTPHYVDASELVVGMKVRKDRTIREVVAAGEGKIFRDLTFRTEDGVEITVNEFVHQSYLVVAQ